MREIWIENGVRTCVFKYRSTTNKRVVYCFQRALLLLFSLEVRFPVGAKVLPRGQSVLLCFCGQRKKGTTGSALVSVFEALYWDQLQEEETGEGRDSQKNDHLLFRGHNAGFVLDL